MRDMLAFVDSWAVAACSTVGDDEARNRKKRKQINHSSAAAHSKEEADVEWKDDAVVEADDDDDEDDWGDSASPPIFPADSVEGWGDDGDDAGDDEDGWGDAIEVEAVVSSRAYQDEVKSDALQLKKHQSYTILTKADIPRLQTAMIKRVSAELSITTSAACTLLRHCHWEENETLRRFKQRPAQARHRGGRGHSAAPRHLPATRR